MKSKKKSGLKFNSSKTYNNKKNGDKIQYMKLKKLCELFKIKQLIIKRTMTMSGRKKTVERML